MHLYDVIRHVLAYGCELYEERGNHAFYRNPAMGATTPLPRHITVGLARVERICAELGLPLPSNHNSPTPAENWSGLMVEIPPLYRPGGSSGPGSPLGTAQPTRSRDATAKDRL